MQILAIHSGVHDSSAAAFNDYELLAAVQQERLIRHKGWGAEVPGSPSMKCYERPTGFAPTSTPSPLCAAISRPSTIAFR